MKVIVNKNGGLTAYSNNNPYAKIVREQLKQKQIEKKQQKIEATKELLSHEKFNYKLRKSMKVGFFQRKQHKHELEGIKTKIHTLSEKLECLEKELKLLTQKKKKL